jgi:hypothetical protein
MSADLKDGLYPVMLTPFTKDGKAVDYDVLRALTNWYIDGGSAGESQFFRMVMWTNVSFHSLNPVFN